MVLHSLVLNLFNYPSCLLEFAPPKGCTLYSKGAQLKRDQAKKKKGRENQLVDTNNSALIAGRRGVGRGRRGYGGINDDGKI